MKRIYLLVFMALTASFSYGQSAKQMLSEIKGHWELDENNNVSVVKVIETPNLSKDEIFNRAFNYLTYNYIDGKSVIQTQDKDNGLIVGKGVFENVHTSFFSLQVDAENVLRVDVKDGRARIIVSLTNFDQFKPSEDSLPFHTTIKVADAYPVNPKGRQKALMTKAFYKAYHRAFDTLEDVESAIKDGNSANTSKLIETENW